MDVEYFHTKHMKEILKVTKKQILKDPLTVFNQRFPDRDSALVAQLEAQWSKYCAQKKTTQSNSRADQANVAKNRRGKAPRNFR